MPALKYVGPAPTNDTDLERRYETLYQLSNTGQSRSYVQGKASTLAVPIATKTYVDTQDALYQPTSYYTTKDALNVPSSALGAANGVAQLTSGKVPVGQMPILGSGYLKGPYGLTSTPAGTVTTGSTPFQLCSWNIGVQSISFIPLAFLSVSMIVASVGRPVVEVRVGNTSQVSYSSQTLVAQGYGRSCYSDYNTVTVLPCTTGTGSMQVGGQNAFDPNTNIQLTAWFYEPGGHSVSTSTSLIASASAYLLRVLT